MILVLFMLFIFFIICIAALLLKVNPVSFLTLNLWPCILLDSNEKNK